MFSLRAMLLAVVVAAICVAGLVYRTPMWAYGVVTLALALLAYGLVAIYLFPNKRSFFIPAVIVGLFYGAFAFWMPHPLITNRIMFDIWHSQSTAAVNKEWTGNPDFMIDRDVAYAALSGNLERMPQFLPDRSMGNIWKMTEGLRSLQQIGHATIAIVLAVATGLVCSYVARRRDMNARPNHVQS